MLLDAGEDHGMYVSEVCARSNGGLVGLSRGTSRDGSRNLAVEGGAGCLGGSACGRSGLVLLGGRGVVHLEERHLS